MAYDVATTDEFDDWLDAQEAEIREAVATRIVRAQSGLFGDVERVGDKVTEMRLHMGPGYRVYFTIEGRVLIILLCGGEKRTQKRDIKKAKALAAKL
jgi:putative addiction module killer protein